jgi:lipopolysaccharide transport system permease protein
VLWSVLQPLGLTILVSFVFSKLFNTDIGEYAPYILSGLVVWDYLVTCAVGGAVAFVQADAYIKQTRHPLAIYTLRNVIAGLIVIALGCTGLIAWVLFAMPERLGWNSLAALLAFPLLAMLAWPWATIMAYIGARFRDLPHALTLILQAMWFVSPIYFEASMFRRGGLGVLLDYNPVYHVLELVRAPLLRGELPTATNFAWVLGSFLVLSIIAILVGRSAERRVIFYL